MRTFLIVLGCLSALLILSQLAMGYLILQGNARVIKAHLHGGYTTVAVSLLYILLSLRMILQTKPLPKSE